MRTDLTQPNISPIEQSIARHGMHMLDLAVGLAHAVSKTMIITVVQMSEHINSWYSDLSPQNTIITAFIVTLLDYEVVDDKGNKLTMMADRKNTYLKLHLGRFISNMLFEKDC
jgi:hypothetical protein